MSYAKNMKYPKKQFDVLVSTLKALDAHIDNLREVNLTYLHFEVSHQHKEGFEHNRLVLTSSGLMRQYSAIDMGIEFEPIVEPNPDFKSYPDGCDDSHVLTAMKRAIKLI